MKKTILALVLAACTLLPGTGCVNKPIVSDRVDTGQIIELDAANFDSLVLAPNVVALVDFYAERCGSCESALWMVKKLAEEYGDRALVGKYNVYSDDSLWLIYDITELPTFVFFSNGAEAARRRYTDIYGSGEYDTLAFIMQGLLGRRAIIGSATPVGQSR